MNKFDMSTIYYCKYKAPCGELLLASYQEELCLCLWNQPIGLIRSVLPRDLLGVQLEQALSPCLSDSLFFLDRYFSGDVIESTIPLRLEGTSFQKSVWQGVLKIPYAQKRSYQDVATSIGQQKGTRAVGQALKSNRIMIFVPCHRVISKKQALSGYRSGSEIKRYLIELEQGTKLLF